MTFERELVLTADRLRQLPQSRLVRHGEAVYVLLDQLTDREVPRLLPHGWADQVLVLGREVPLHRQEALAIRLRDLRRRFDLTIG